MAARTKLLTRYDPVLSEDDEWAQVTKALSDVFAGKNPPAPSYEEREAELGGHDAGLERKGSAWRHTNFIATVMGTAGLLWCYFLPAVFGGTGRAKIKSGMVATLMLGGAFFFVCHSPKYFFFFREDVDDASPRRVQLERPSKSAATIRRMSSRPSKRIWGSSRR